MSNKTKAVSAKKNINIKKLVRKFVAKPLAYVTLFLLASYGMREVLKTINDTASTIFTVLTVLGLVYILFVES